jgi:hypothetical protein
MNADPFVLHPSDVTMSLDVVVFHQQREAVWNSDGARDFQTCARNRDVAHNATDCALVECDHARFQSAEAHVFSIFRHGQ